MTLSSVIERSKSEREDWRYTDLSRLESVAFGSPAANTDNIAIPATSGARLVFVNGVWDDKLSDLRGLPDDIMQGDAANGYTLMLAGKTCLITMPMTLRYVSTTQTNPTETTTKLRIVLGNSCRLTLIEEHTEAPTDQPFAHCVETTIDLAPNAKLVHAKIVQSANVHLANTALTIGEGAFYDGFSIILNGQLTRHEITATLDGPMAQCSLQGAMLLRAASHADTTTRIVHNKPNGTSRQIFKSVLAEKAHAVFQGKVIVAKDAQKSDGYQLSRALLLSDQAEMDAKPELEINADDVQCSHGSTIGCLDDEALFYLRSRGISEQEAKQILIRAFIDDLIDTIQSPDCRAAIATETGVWLHAE